MISYAILIPVGVSGKIAWTPRFANAELQTETRLWISASVAGESVNVIFEISFPTWKQGKLQNGQSWDKEK
jgi:hypothetical protein